jgi:5'-3' exonuclease
MGVRGLIGVLERTCGNAKQEMTGEEVGKRMHEKGNRVLVVDAMNFLFYLAGLEKSRGLRDELNTFCAFLRKEGITAACVFDSSKLSQKRHAVADDRRQQRTAAIQEIGGLCNAKGKIPFSSRHRHALLRSRTIHVNPTAVREAQEQLSRSGVCTVFMAVDEADSVCVDMVKNGTAFACLSNDSDMFVQGCPYVMRKYNPENVTFEFWDTAKVYDEVGMDEVRFQETCEAASVARLEHNELYSLMCEGCRRVPVKV